MATNHKKKGWILQLVILTFSSFATVSYMVMLLTFPYCTIKSISVVLVKVLFLLLFAKLLSASVTVEFSVASTNCGCVQAKLIVVLERQSAELVFAAVDVELPPPLTDDEPLDILDRDDDMWLTGKTPRHKDMQVGVTPRRTQQGFEFITHLNKLKSSVEIFPEHKGKQAVGIPLARQQVTAVSLLETNRKILISSLLPFAAFAILSASISSSLLSWSNECNAVKHSVKSCVICGPTPVGRQKVRLSASSKGGGTKNTSLDSLAAAAVPTPASVSLPLPFFCDLPIGVPESTVIKKHVDVAKINSNFNIMTSIFMDVVDNCYKKDKKKSKL
uniref:Uncharacterized protein n=1 Tax=Glossina pallidipes TaxID=7398 RepID=A0A1A9Z1R9_GLOPL